MKKRALSLLMAFVMVVGLLPTAAFAARGTLKGSGTEGNPYLIEDADDLAKVSNDLTAHYKLTENIGTETAPVTTAIDGSFTGTFDGDGHTITLNITASGNNTGLFSQIAAGGTVKNVITAGTLIGTGKSYIGGIAGKCDGTIDKCGNTATVKGKIGVGGIVGQVDATTATISNCYNAGEITATSRQAGGIVGSAQWATIRACVNYGTISGKSSGGGIYGGANSNKTKVTNCHWLEGKSSFAQSVGSAASYTAGTVNSVISRLGADWMLDDNNNPILKFGPVEASVALSADSGLLQMKNYDDQPYTTLTAEPKNMDTTGATVEWSVEPEGIIELSDTDDAFHKIATAAAPGTATIKATVKAQGDAEIESNTASIVVRPCFTTVEIKPVAPSVTVAAGQTVQAVVSVFQNTGSYDPADDTRLSYKWYWYQDSTDKHEIEGETEGETGKTCTIPTEFPGATGSLYLYVEVCDNGRPAQNSVGETLFGYAPLPYGAAALLEADKAALTRAVLGAEGKDIKSALTLNLPAAGSVNQSTITWSCEPSGVINTVTGQVTLPDSGKVTVKLTATFSREGADNTLSTPFEYTVWSQQAVDAEGDGEKLEAAIGRLSTLQPQFGKDGNILTMVEAALARNGDADVSVSLRSVEPTNATAAEAFSSIAKDGSIAYFYDDPNTVRSQWFDTYSATFAFSYGKASTTAPLSVTVRWDEDKVKQAMTGQIVSKVTLPETTEENFDLPKVIDDKKWTLIEWTSYDFAISISTEKQNTADTLFDPYVGVVTRQTLDQQVALTAKFTFQLTDSQIVLYKVYYVTVKGDPNAENRNALYQDKLDKALAAHLTDAVTGEQLTAVNGVYTVYNDVHFPTTRDMKIDGKYTPVVITSSDTAVIAEPDVANAARVEVYRPLPGEQAKTVTLTVSILDRPGGPQAGENLGALPVLATRQVEVAVQPLTQEEIDSEIALMQQAKANYWNGIKNKNDNANNVTANLHPFTEYTQAGEWVYANDDMTGSGIVPVPLDNWYDQQVYRLFRSSNADVVAHENLLVTRGRDSEAVTITSYLSSETLGKYAEKYPENVYFQQLYKQPVSVKVVVTGTQYAQADAAAREEAAQLALSRRAMVTVKSFTLTGTGMGFTESDLSYDKGSTVFDVFLDMLARHGYSCSRRGSYIAAITSDSGVTLEEFNEGKNSGWMYRVNGELVGRYMSAQGLKDGDSIELYFTSDWTSEPGAGDWQKPSKTETVTNEDGSTTKTETKADGTVVETTTRTDGGTFVAETKPDGSVETIENRADGTEVRTSAPAGSTEITASVRVPKSVGSTRVDIPVSKPTGGMVAVIVHPDGTEEIIKSSVVTEAGVTLRAEGDMQIKVVDRSKSFADTEKHWSREAVEFASSRELFNGVSEDSFGPNLSMTRGMVNTVLARLAGADTTGGGKLWYAKGTEWAKENGISDGTNPEQEVTREQLATMLWRYAGSPAVDGELGFEDAGVVSIWAYDAIKWCVDNGIMNGIGNGQVAPKELAQRGQVAAMLMRFLQATV